MFTDNTTDQMQAKSEHQSNIAVSELSNVNFDEVDDLLDELTSQQIRSPHTLEQCETQPTEVHDTFGADYTSHTADDEDQYGSDEQGSGSEDEVDQFLDDLLLDVVISSPTASPTIPRNSKTAICAADNNSNLFVVVQGRDRSLSIPRIILSDSILSQTPTITTTAPTPTSLSAASDDQQNPNFLVTSSPPSLLSVPPLSSALPLVQVTTVPKKNTTAVSISDDDIKPSRLRRASSSMYLSPLEEEFDKWSSYESSSNSSSDIDNCGHEDKIIGSGNHFVYDDDSDSIRYINTGGIITNSDHDEYNYYEESNGDNLIEELSGSTNSLPITPPITNLSNYQHYLSQYQCSTESVSLLVDSHNLHDISNTSNKIDNIYNIIEKNTLININSRKCHSNDNHVIYNNNTNSKFKFNEKLQPYVKEQKEEPTKEKEQSKDIEKQEDKQQKEKIEIVKNSEIDKNETIETVKEMNLVQKRVAEIEIKEKRIQTEETKIMTDKSNNILEDEIFDIDEVDAIELLQAATNDGLHYTIEYKDGGTNQMLQQKNNHYNTNNNNNTFDNENDLQILQKTNKNITIIQENNTISPNNTNNVSEISQQYQQRLQSLLLLLSSDSIKFKQQEYQHQIDKNDTTIPKTNSSFLLPSTILPLQKEITNFNLINVTNNNNIAQQSFYSNKNYYTIKEMQSPTQSTAIPHPSLFYTTQQSHHYTFSQQSNIQFFESYQQQQQFPFLQNNRFEKKIKQVNQRVSTLQSELGLFKT